ncbi:hypothetical protein LAZ67_18001878 [Cordylochernes scorpioides]|uniref:Uncharacterized protein n=1 Tax=Cordylochernes scorpioides TaxID=51811 RepID=A0ABY6LG57_9ARAC|nr:hypothetical protein LAZ67_18001878 [Cordylochernes scorpioides]
MLSVTAALEFVAGHQTVIRSEVFLDLPQELQAEAWLRLSRGSPGLPDLEVPTSALSLEGTSETEDDLHTGRPLSIRNPENALKIKLSIKENPRITIRELSEDLDISFGTCQTIMKNDLHLK